MKHSEIISKTAQHVRNTLALEGSGHDWWHVYRVWKNALQIGKHEDVDMYVVELAALLHDIADWKFHDGDEMAGGRAARTWLASLAIGDDVIDRVCDIVTNISFKGANVESGITSAEGKVVQDADRLDAIGAVGIARAFAYGGHKGTPIHDPEVSPRLHNSFHEYKAKSSPTINHFYEKLLLLKDKMHTPTARRIAEDRHNFMIVYLDRFLSEFDGRDVFEP